MCVCVRVRARVHACVRACELVRICARMRVTCVPADSRRGRQLQGRRRAGGPGPKCGPGAPIPAPGPRVRPSARPLPTARLPTPPSLPQGWYRAYRNGQTGVVPANYLSDYLSDSAGTAAAHVAIQEAHAPVPTTVQAHATASEQQPAVPDMLPDLQAILDMLVSNSIQVPAARGVPRVWSAHRLATALLDAVCPCVLLDRHQPASARKQDPRAVEKHIAGSPFLNTQSAEAALLSSIMRQVSTSTPALSWRVVCALGAGI